MKKKILMSLALMAVMCFSVSAINIYNHTFDEPSRTTPPLNAAVDANVVTGGWWYLSAGGWVTNCGLAMGYSPGKANSMAAYVGWLTPANNDIRQDIPGPTFNNAIPPHNMSRIFHR